MGSNGTTETPFIAPAPTWKEKVKKDQEANRQMPQQYQRWADLSRLMNEIEHFSDSCMV